MHIGLYVLLFNALLLGIPLLLVMYAFRPGRHGGGGGGRGAGSGEPKPPPAAPTGPTAATPPKPLPACLIPQPVGRGAQAAQRTPELA